VTIGDTTFKLDRPFLVLATQNPIEQEGTTSSGSTGRSFYVENGY
jgi:MoxR-like ATPase